MCPPAPIPSKQDNAAADFDATEILQTRPLSALRIRGGRVIDPSTNRDEIADVVIVDGRTADADPGDSAEVDATGWIVCPGLMDIHVHLREPGHTHKETIETGTAAAAAGGFTDVACMPNTDPPIDDPTVVRSILDSACAADHCGVWPIAAITRGRAGAVLTDFEALAEAGAVAFSDDGVGVENDAVMLGAFERARAVGLPLIQHCEYRHLSAGGVMHLGEVSRRLGLAGLDPRSEEAMIERDIDLCRQSGGRYHVAHISTARAVELVRRAKAEGLPVTAEVCTHHLVLTDEACANREPNTKMHPPLRPESDVTACRAGLLDGTIDCIVTDHAPHTDAEKNVAFEKAPPGIVGLETALGLAAKAMIDTGLADWASLVRWFTTGPASVLGNPPPSIRTDGAARLTLIDPTREWIVDPARFISKSRNTPFAGCSFRGKPVATVRGDRLGTSEGALLKAAALGADNRAVRSRRNRQAGP